MAALNAHPAIGARNLSERSASEQGQGGHPAVLTELAYLNQVYEEKFGFRFVVFVDGRPKSDLLPVLQQRLERTRDVDERGILAASDLDRAWVGDGHQLPPPHPQHIDGWARHDGKLTQISHLPIFALASVTRPRLGPRRSCPGCDRGLVV